MIRNTNDGLNKFGEAAWKFETMPTSEQVVCSSIFEEQCSSRQAALFAIVSLIKPRIIGTRLYVWE